MRELKKIARLVTRKRTYGRRLTRPLYRKHAMKRSFPAAARLRELLYRAAVAAMLLMFILGARRLLASGERITVNAETVAAFRAPYRSIGLLKAYANKHSFSFAEVFTLFCAENAFFPEKAVTYDLSVLESQYVQNFDRLKHKYDANSATPYYEMYRSLFDEIECFPVPAGFDGEDAPSYIYGDSWGVTRNYESDKTHIGTDILDRENIRGRIPVVSMTDGHVRDAGWHDSLGYYTGVETVNGTYYLYAHLDGLAEGIAPGRAVSAGQDLGRMGDSGGGRENGAFQVHLHLAVSPKAGFSKNNFYINPYPLLRYIEEVENPPRF